MALFSPKAGSFNSFFLPTAKLMKDLWVPDRRVRKWILPRRSESESDTNEGIQIMACGHFQQKYDKVQGLIQQIGCMDELLSGK